jgi:hypothetical protein
LIKKQDKSRIEARKSVEEHEYYKARGAAYGSEAEFHWLSYRTWSDETHRLGGEIQVKLKAVQKYEQPKDIEMEMEKFKTIDNK